MFFISAALIGVGMAAGAWLIDGSLPEASLGVILAGGLGGLCARGLLRLVDSADDWGSR